MATKKSKGWRSGVLGASSRTMGGYATLSRLRKTLQPR